MEYYDYKEIANAGNSTSTSTDQVIVIAVTSSLGGIFLFILICCCCSACFSGWIDNCINSNLSHGDEEYGQIALRRIEEEKERKKEKPTVRKEKLLSSFERNKVSMVVTEHSFVQKLNKVECDETAIDSTSTSSASSEDKSDDIENSNNPVVVDVSSVLNDIETGEEPKELYLPVTSSSKEKNDQFQKDQKRKIPNCCAVCLCSYDIGDTVIWSCNKECHHAFHDECIIPWLVKNQNGECPCCRRHFTDLAPPDGNNNNNNRPSIWSIGSCITRIRYTFISQRE